MIKSAGKSFDENIDLNAVNDAQKAIFKEMDRQSGGALARQRADAYHVRWREALIYSRPGGRILDIGCGWPISDIYELIINESGLEYYCVDIDPAIVDLVSDQFKRLGIPAGRIKKGPNTKLDFPSGKFDMVFSSHCIEHSTDLTTTFREISRVLKPGGIVFFAVPLGFDDSDEHLLYLDVDDWQRVVGLAGFDVINLHLGKTYPMAGWDLSIVARSGGEADIEELGKFMSGKTKYGKSLVSPKVPFFVYQSSTVSGRHVILEYPHGEVTITAPGLTDLLFLAHDWSGFAEVTHAGGRRLLDLFSRVPVVKAVDVRGIDGPISIKPAGPSGAVFSQVVVYGGLVRAT